MRSVCGALALLATALFAVGLPAYFESFRTLSVIRNEAYRDVARANLSRLGLSVDFYAGYYVALAVVFAAVCFAIGALIFKRRSDDPMALFVALVLVMLGATLTGSTDALGTLHPAWMWLGSALSSFSLGSVLLFFYIFPDGRFVPSWMRWPIGFFIAYIVFASLLPGSPFNPEGGGPGPGYALLLLGGVLASILAQGYRYRRASNPVQRQQIKWVGFGFAVALSGYLGVMLILLPAVSPTFEPGSLTDFVSVAAALCFMLSIPLSIGIAILRYRLFDIDVVINRTLVYGLLTAALVLTYLGSVVSLQRLLSPLVGQESQLAVVASTLTIAALFNPLRRRIQAVVDRRFYRRKYDAAKTLEAFSTKLRNETDLESLRSEVLAVVEDTVQPAGASLWLRDPPSGETKRLHKLRPGDRA